MHGITKQQLSLVEKRIESDEMKIKIDGLMGLLEDGRSRTEDWKQ